MDGARIDEAFDRMDLTRSGYNRSQGYVLFVGVTEKYMRGVIAVGGVGPEGTYFGLQSVRQLTVAKDNRLYVRTGEVTDWPNMEWRGSKRPAAWEDRYKASWGRLPHHPFRSYFAAGADPQRQLKSWELGTDARRTASRGLDASNRYIDHLVEQWKTAYKATGQPFFSLKGDDIELELDKRSGTHDRFKGDVGAAFVHLLSQLDQRLKAIDPRCTVYWMPNPYYTINWDFVPLSRQVRRAGGIPNSVGLSVQLAAALPGHQPRRTPRSRKHVTSLSIRSDRARRHARPWLAQRRTVVDR